MVSINVFDVGEKNLVWKYFDKSCAALSLRMMTFMDLGEGACFVDATTVGTFNDLLLFWLVIWMFHKPSPEQLL